MLMTSGLALLLSTAVTAVDPHQSFHFLATSNGYAAAVWDGRGARLASLRGHLYAEKAPGSPVRELAGEASFGLRIGGKPAWLSSLSGARARYLPGTGIVESVQVFEGVEATTYLIAPFEVAAPAVAVLLKVRNLGATALGPDDAAFSLHDFRMGDGPAGSSGERIDWDATRKLFVERGSGGALVVRPVEPADRHACSPASPREALAAGDDFQDCATSGDADDATGGFQWSLAGLPSDGTRWIGFIVGHSDEPDQGPVAEAIRVWAEDRPSSELLQSEESGWLAWHSSTVEPADLSEDERPVFLQQLALLRMAQVREANVPYAERWPHGQIVSSLAAGPGRVSKARDLLIASLALSRAGHGFEARAALAFVLEAPAGERAEPYVGVPYQVSVFGWRGDGSEFAPVLEDGPVISFDGFGLFLEALDLYERTSGDLSLAEERWAAVEAGVAQALSSLVEPDGLLRADSSIREGGWDGPRRKRWAWTSIHGALGLRAAAAVAARHGRAEAASAWRAQSDRIRGAIEGLLTAEDGSLDAFEKQSLEEADASTLEAFARGLLSRDGDAARATIARVRARLSVASGHGIRLASTGADAELLESPFADLLLASASYGAGNPGSAEALLEWLTDLARLNGGQLPEALDPSTGDYLGATPMTGLGAGAYVRALFGRTDPIELPEPSPPDEPEKPDARPPEAQDTSQTGCGCGSGPGGPALALAALGALPSLLRRRPTARPRSPPGATAER